MLKCQKVYANIQVISDIPKKHLRIKCYSITAGIVQTSFLHLVFCNHAEFKVKRDIASADTHHTCK
jgi:hypothetical protein